MFSTPETSVHVRDKITCRNAVQRFEEERVDHLVAKRQLRKTEPPLPGTFDVPPAVGCVNPGSDYFHTTGPIVRDDETRRIHGSVHSIQCAVLLYVETRAVSTGVGGGLITMYVCMSVKKKAVKLAHLI